MAYRLLILEILLEIVWLQFTMMVKLWLITVHLMNTFEIFGLTKEQFEIVCKKANLH